MRSLSLNQIEDVFEVILKDQPPFVACKPPPSRATIGRWILAFCLLAAPVLRVLDKHTRPLVKRLCPDEIFFHGKPALVAVEPLSLAVLLAALGALLGFKSKIRAAESAARTQAFPLEGPGGTITVYSYDAQGRRTMTQDEQGPVTVYHYDASGKLTSVTPPPTPPSSPRPSRKRRRKPPQA